MQAERALRILGDFRGEHDAMRGKPVIEALVLGVARVEMLIHEGRERAVQRIQEARQGKEQRGNRQDAAYEKRDVLCESALQGVVAAPVSVPYGIDTVFERRGNPGKDVKHRLHLP